MDWPDLADGRRRLVNTRRAIIGVAVKQGWIATQKSWLLLGPDPQEVLAAARPWIERERRRQLGETESPEGRRPRAPAPARLARFPRPGPETRAAR